MTKKLIPEKKKKCKVKWCNREARPKGFCLKHRQHIISYGYVFPKRTKFDPNEFIVEGDICRIKLYNSFGFEIGETIIDAEDTEKCKPFKWQVSCIGQNKDPYVSTQIKNKGTLYLHKLIMNFEIGNNEIDHKNSNTFNNRKNNLRIATHAQNLMNRGIQKNNTSGYKGVSKRRKKWGARIVANSVLHLLGVYETPEQAALAYNEAAEKYHGEFAYFNTI